MVVFSEAKKSFQLCLIKSQVRGSLSLAGLLSAMYFSGSKNSMPIINTPTTGRKIHKNAHGVTPTSGAIFHSITINQINKASHIIARMRVIRSRLSKPIYDKTPAIIPENNGHKTITSNKPKLLMNFCLASAGFNIITTLSRHTFVTFATSKLAVKSSITRVNVINVINVY